MRRKNETKCASYASLKYIYKYIDFLQTNGLIFSYRLGGLKQLQGKISSWKSSIPAVQKKDPALWG